MSYSIMVSGHDPTVAPEDQQEHEESVMAKARQFAQSLPGVHTASMQGAATGSTNLLPVEVEEPTQAEEATPSV